MSKARTELIHCDNCGEDYAATYRRCPFCDAKPGQRFEPVDETEYEEPFDDDDGYAPASPRGGKRLAGGSRGGGRGPGFWLRIVLYVLSAVVILAAIWVLCTYIFPRFFPAGEAQPSPSPSEMTATAAPSSSPIPSEDPVGGLTPLPAVDDDPLSLDSPDLPPVETDPISSQTPVSSQAPIASQAPASSQTPVSTAAPAALKLSSTDFTLSPKYPTYQLEIEGVGRAQATYEMSDPNVATVSSGGLVTAVANGNTTLTVTAQNGASATAVVRVSGMGAPAQSSAGPSPAPASASGQATLNHTDFTINAAYPDPVRLRVTGGQAVGWSSSDGGVASVSDNGTVTAVGNGTAKITCTLSDGATLTCTVRVSGK